MSETLLAAANELLAKIQEKVSAIKKDPKMAEILSLQQALNGIEEHLKRPKTTMAQVFGLDGPTAEEQGPQLAPDTFHRLEPLDAAKKYLGIVGRPARKFSEILEAIRAHGCSVPDQAKLAKQMARSTYKLSKVGDDMWGLTEWYGSVRRGRAAGARADEDEEPEVQAQPDDEPPQMSNENVVDGQFLGGEEKNAASS